MEPAELSTMLKPFLRRSQKIQWKENHAVATLWKPIRSGLDRFFFRFPSKKAVCHYIWDKYSSRQTNPSLKDLARQGLISFTKHQRAISGEDLEVLYAANQLGLNAPESFANSFSTSEREAVKTNARWNPVTLSSKQQQPAEVLHLRRESDEKSVHLQVLEILLILCFTNVNSETEIHFFLVKFMNSTSENMNQERQVFEFLIQGALRRINFTWQLVKFGPITVEIRLVKPIKFTLLPHVNHAYSPSDITNGFFTKFTSGFWRTEN